MKHSRRGRRMRQHHRRGRQGAASLNLVSLMDIFTILVFFLLVNSGDIEVLPNTKIIQLPESIAEQKPRETMVVMVTDTDIFVQGEQVMRLEEAKNSSDASLFPLISALKLKSIELLGELNDQQGVREITILGGKTLPYHLLKKIIFSCSQAKFGKVSLAVVQKSPQEGR